MPDRRVAALLGLAVMAAAVAWLLPPIPQDPAYHAFADGRSALGIPNAANVLSNLGFAIVGLVGLASRAGRRSLPRWQRAATFVLFSGAILTAAGSAYYHLAPGNGRLVCDRLPITLVFMALLALVVGDRVDKRAGRLLFIPLLVAGAASVVSWHVSELGGRGDLRFYGLVQFFPMLAVPLILVLFPARSTGGAWLWAAVGLYAVAKAAEAGDRLVFSLTGIVSGHTVKHVAAALALGCVLAMLTSRCVCPPSAVPVSR